MLLPVTLGGSELLWQLKDALRLQRWLEGCPWEARGSVECLCIASAEQSTAIAEHIERQIVGIVQGRADTIFQRLEIEELSAGLAQAVEGRLEISASAPRQSRLQTLARIARDRGLVVFTPALEPGVLIEVHEQAMLLVDELSKLDPPAPIVIFPVGLRGRAFPAQEFDLSQGRPAEAILDFLEQPEPTLWAVYKHLRLAWESGGSMATAQGWSERGGLASLKGDEALEKRLNEISVGAYDALSSEEQEGVQRFLGGLVSGAASQEDPLALALMGAGATWTPNPGMPLALCPWVSRALLLQRPLDTYADYLKNSLTCGWIAAECLQACFDLEYRVRACLRQQPLRGAFQRRTEELFRECADNSPTSEARFYPKDCPATPHDIENYASFGDILSVKAGDRKRFDSYHALRDLRNALAHGHYVSWQTLQALKTLRAALA